MQARHEQWSMQEDSSDAYLKAVLQGSAVEHAGGL